MSLEQQCAIYRERCDERTPECPSHRCCCRRRAMSGPNSRRALLGANCLGGAAPPLWTRGANRAASTVARQSATRCKTRCGGGRRFGCMLSQLTQRSSLRVDDEPGAPAWKTSRLSRRRRPAASGRGLITPRTMRRGNCLAGSGPCVARQQPPPPVVVAVAN